MSELDIFIPDPKHEADKLAVVEHALGAAGLIDSHLRWVETADAPSTAISDRDYGFLPPRFTGEHEGYRPSREPINFKELIASKLGITNDGNYAEFADRVAEVESGWFDYIVATDLVDPDNPNAIMDAAHDAYRLDTLTEDNLPAYVSFLLGDAKALADKHGVKIPALMEWSRGIWTAEENAHMLTMNEYGDITGITNSPEHTAGRNSQLRAGTEITLEHVIQLFAYTSWQELSTQIAHTRDGRLFGPVGFVLLDGIGKDEARHHHVYQSVLEALYKDFPEDTIRTLHSVLMKPFMPGKKGIPNFTRKSLAIHKSAIFGIEQAHKAGQRVLQKIGLLDETKDVSGVSIEAVVARDELRAQYKGEVQQQRRNTAKFVLNKTIAKELSDARKAYSNEMGLAA